MRGVCDETAQPPFRRLLRLEGRLDVAEHRVQRQAEAPDLRLLVRPRDALSEVAGRDRTRGRLDLPQRPQAQADDPEAKRREPGED